MGTENLIIELLLNNVNELTKRVTELEAKVDELTNSISHDFIQSPQITNSLVQQSQNKFNAAPRSPKDSTQYIFNGLRYGKGRIVLAVVQQYVKDNPEKTAEELETTFDKNMQGTYGVVRKIEDIKQNWTQPERRFFMSSNDIIHASDAECAVCSQWGKFNIDNFISHAIKLGYSIEQI